MTLFDHAASRAGRRSLGFVMQFDRQERNQRRLGNKIVWPEFHPLPTEGTIQRRRRLGGLLSYSQWEAA